MGRLISEKAPTHAALQGEVARRSRDGGVDTKLKNLNNPSVTYGDSSPFRGALNTCRPCKGRWLGEAETEGLTQS